MRKLQVSSWMFTYADRKRTVDLLAKNTIGLIIFPHAVRIYNVAELSCGKRRTALRKENRVIFNVVIAAIRLSGDPCLRAHGCVSFLVVWECIAMCLWRKKALLRLLAWLKPERKASFLLSLNWCYFLTKHKVKN